ncbi:MAG: FKBP-type peptidyl-prolyl cis-trans isomerase [Candidatus Micrarchaeia archaeon]
MEEDKAKNSNQSANNQNQNQNPKSSKINKKSYLIAGIIVVIAIIAVIFAFGSSSQTVVAGDNVSVYYTGSFPNGTVFNTNVGGKLLNFTAGSNQLIPGFSDAVIGMKVGQNKTVTLTPNEAYGPVNPKLIVSVPANAFNSNTLNTMKPGMVVTSPTGAQGLILSKNNTTVVVNFNPPLAGKTLIFNIKLVSINK